jgi:hypothetical protein
VEDVERERRGRVADRLPDLGHQPVVDAYARWHPDQSSDHAQDRAGGHHHDQQLPRAHPDRLHDGDVTGALADVEEHDGEDPHRRDQPQDQSEDAHDRVHGVDVRVRRNAVDGHGQEVWFLGLDGGSIAVGVGTRSKLDEIAIGLGMRLGGGEGGPVEPCPDVDRGDLSHDVEPKRVTGDDTVEEAPHLQMGLAEDGSGQQHLARARAQPPAAHQH